MPDRDAVDRAFGEAFRNLDRLADIKIEHRNHSNDPLTRWKSNMPKQPKSSPKPQSLTDAELQRFIDARVAAAVADLPSNLKSIATAIDAVQKGLRLEFADQITKLKSEFDLRISALQQATEKLERGLSDDRGQIVDLPSPFIRKTRNDAA